MASDHDPTWKSPGGIYRCICGYDTDRKEEIRQHVANATSK